MNDIELEITVEETGLTRIDDQDTEEITRVYFIGEDEPSSQELEEETRVYFLAPRPARSTAS